MKIAKKSIYRNLGGGGEMLGDDTQPPPLTPMTNL